MSKTYNGRFPSPPEPPSGSKWIVGGLLMIPLWSIPFAGTAILAGSTPAHALRRAAAASALAIGKPGAAKSIPWAEEVTALEPSR